MCMRTSVLWKPNYIFIVVFLGFCVVITETFIRTHSEGLPLSSTPPLSPASAPCTRVGCWEEGKAEGSFGLHWLPCSLGKPLCRTCRVGSVPSASPLTSTAGTTRSPERKSGPDRGSAGLARAKKGPPKPEEVGLLACLQLRENDGCHVVSVHHILLPLCTRFVFQRHAAASHRRWMWLLGLAKPVEVPRDLQHVGAPRSQCVILKPLGLSTQIFSAHVKTSSAGYDFTHFLLTDFSS